MKTYQHTLTIPTSKRQLVNITAPITALIPMSEVKIGICHIFLQHTSASLIICENNDPKVQQDLEVFFHDLVPDGDPRYQHVEEGPDDMSAHVRTVLTNSALSLPITDNQLALGTWQGIYIWEHRLRSYHRRVIITIQGS